MAVALSGYRAESLWLRCEGCGCPLPQTFRRKPPGGRVPKPSRFDRRLARMNERPKLESSKVIANVGKWVCPRQFGRGSSRPQPVVQISHRERLHLIKVADQAGRSGRSASRPHLGRSAIKCESLKPAILH